MQNITYHNKPAIRCVLRFKVFNFERRDDTYYYSGTQLIGEETNGNITLYVYDANGLPIGLRYHAANAIPVVGVYLSGAITGTYATVTSIQSGAPISESVMVGVVTATTTSLSITNISNLGIYNDVYNIVTAATSDFVFGMGANSIAAAVYKAVQKKATQQNSK